MPKLNLQEINDALGWGGKVPDPPETPEGKVIGLTKAMDDKLDALVSKHRTAGETHEQAYDRLLRENPQLADRYQEEKAKILKAHGIPNGGATGAS